MNIETRLTLNNIKRNRKRTLFTIISIALCTVLIFITILLVSSIRNGITENIETEYNDYHIAIKNLDIEIFNKIKNKEYIDKIYIKDKDSEQLKQLEKPYELVNSYDEINVYIKYKDIRKTCEYSTDIIQIIECI